MSVTLIAECATNHGGDLRLAKEFIKRFADAGADYLKFQYTRIQHLRPTDPQYEWFKTAEFTDAQFFELAAETQACGKTFLLTIYNEQDIEHVLPLSPHAIKIGSGEAGDDAFLKAVKKQWQKVFVGGGLATPLNDGHTHDLLACVTRYPAPHDCVPLTFGPWDTYQGWSDHCIGLSSCQVAIVRGATVIEKHVQLDVQRRPPKTYEATPREFAALRAFADEDPTRFLGRWQYA